MLLARAQQRDSASAAGVLDGHWVRLLLLELNYMSHKARQPVHDG
jgi:hypothetical protein